MTGGKMYWTPIDGDAVERLVNSLSCADANRANAYALVHVILHNARREPGVSRGEKLERGDVIMTLEELGAPARIGRNTVKNLIGKHLNGVFVTIKATNRMTNRFSILHVIDMDTYVRDLISSSQPDSQPDSQPLANRSPTASQPLAIHTPEHCIKREKEKEYTGLPGGNPDMDALEEEEAELEEGETAADRAQKKIEKSKHHDFIIRAGKWLYSKPWAKPPSKQSYWIDLGELRLILESDFKGTKDERQQRMRKILYFIPTSTTGNDGFKGWIHYAKNFRMLRVVKNGSKRWEKIEVSMAAAEPPRIYDPGKKSKAGYEDHPPMTFPKRAE